MTTFQKFEGYWSELWDEDLVGNHDNAIVVMFMLFRLETKKLSTKPLSTLLSPPFRRCAPNWTRNREQARSPLVDASRIQVRFPSKTSIKKRIEIAFLKGNKLQTFCIGLSQALSPKPTTYVCEL